MRVNPYSGPNAALRDASSGKRLDAYLKAHKVSRNELSRRTGVSIRAIRSIISGDREGNMATWRTFARALGCTLDDIVEV